MVVPSPATRTRSRKPRHKRNVILTVLAVTVIAVGVAWLITLSLLRRNGSPEARIQPRAMETEDADAGVGAGVDAATAAGEKAAGTHGVMHLSAKSMLHAPHVMYGTAWKKDATDDLVFQAVHHGFRFIDTACQPKHYNEAGVGRGWKLAADQLGLEREDLFLQTKFTDVSGQDPSNLPYDVNAELEDQVRKSVAASLRNLQTDYIDSVLLHSPLKTMDLTLRAWKVLEDFVEVGKIKQLGISNCYDLKKFLTLHQQATIKPTVLQNRFYRDSNFDVELRKTCKSLDVQYQSFWTLTASRKAIASPEWKAVARDKGLTPQTLMYAFMMTLGHTPLSGTKNAGHMAEDVDIMLRLQHGETVLSDSEINRLSSLLGIE